MSGERRVALALFLLPLWMVVFGMGIVLFGNPGGVNPAAAGVFMIPPMWGVGGWLWHMGKAS